jgi:hypothetical protein
MGDGEKSATGCHGLRLTDAIGPDAERRHVEAQILDIRSMPNGARAGPAADPAAPWHWTSFAVLYG